MIKSNKLKNFINNISSITEIENSRIRKTNLFLLIIISIATASFMLLIPGYTGIKSQEKSVLSLIMFTALVFFNTIFFIKQLKVLLMYIYPLGAMFFVFAAQYIQNGVIDNSYIYFPLIVMSGLYTKSRPLFTTTIFSMTVNILLYINNKNRFFPQFDDAQFLVYLICLLSTGAIVWFVMKRDTYLLKKSKYDYDEQIRLNEVIEKERSTLEKRVIERTDELQRAYNELKKAETNLVQHEKMASLGMISAGIAHEINTPIGAIKSNVDIYKILISNIKKSGDLVQDIKLADNVSKLEQVNNTNIIACERISQIINSLKNFVRSDESNFEEADIHSAIESTLILLNNKIKNRINVIKDFGNMPLIKCSIGQINQVIMNLLVNAIDAIRETGTIWIKTGQKDNKIVISIKDSGAGIPKDCIERIYEPGFTTKERGKGTGLGLSIVNNIIENHKGNISVKSQMNEGTEFIIELPC